MRCTHASPAQPGAITCALGQYGGNPAASICRRCPHYHGPPRGVGDVIVSAVRIVRPAHVPCGGCQERREKLNGTP